MEPLAYTITEARAAARAGRTRQSSPNVPQNERPRGDLLAGELSPAGFRPRQHQNTRSRREVTAHSQARAAHADACRDLHIWIETLPEVTRNG
jgi:hypothetical protein